MGLRTEIKGMASGFRWGRRPLVPPHDSGRDCERYSLAFFHNANWDAVIEAVPTCVPDGEDPRYPPVTAGRHLMDKFRSTQPGDDG